MPSRVRLLAPQLLPRRRPTSLPVIHHRLFVFTGLDSAGPPHRFSATRKLPFAAESLYHLIVDIDSYKSFVPYCPDSRVTQWSELDRHGRRWPIKAVLTVGWGRITESFTSQLTCVPGVSVEAVNLDDSDRDHVGTKPVFKSLFTRWSLRPISPQPRPQTEVHFDISYQFNSLFYDKASHAVSFKVADVMIEAFEKRAQQKLSQTSPSTY
ncbi:hypothetical protein XA68_15712 [Ophiocordyceps unilateralis]|uniref:Coenzyme Q-binding protein COQ10 START domain-containing protein n=1 Tax=Ophiocordyceps unilateralis TaxID=268505 RepID=A0A2A9PM46_OPHUN|nr:hypothetical protein XA68_15712 [Ophiocordyceps unilateralis]